MATYMITYDLKKPGQGYAGLHSAIKTYGTHWHILESTWIVETLDSRRQVIDKLLPHLDKNDKIVVAKMSSETVWWGFSDEGTKWLKAKLAKK